MAKTLTANLSVTVAGDGISGETYVPAGYPVTNNSANAGGEFPYVLAAGDNTIAVPAGANGYILRLPSGSTVAVQVRSGLGVVGPSINPGLPFGPHFFSSPSPANIYLNAASQVTAYIFWL